MACMKNYVRILFRFFRVSNRKSMGFYKDSIGTSMGILCVYKDPARKDLGNIQGLYKESFKHSMRFHGNSYRNARRTSTGVLQGLPLVFL